MSRLGWAELTALGILSLLTLHLTATGGPIPGLCALAVTILASRCFIADAQVDEALARLDEQYARYVIRETARDAAQAAARDAQTTQLLDMLGLTDD
jgi:hypothetical protein